MPPMKNNKNMTQKEPGGVLLYEVLTNSAKNTMHLIAIYTTPSYQSQVCNFKLNCKWKP